MEIVNQAEMPWMKMLPTLRFVGDDVVRTWTTKRDAVIWCWSNRPKRGLNEPDDQSMCARFVGMHVPHMSRCVNKRTKAPMDMKSEYVRLFELYTGWRGVSQFEMRDRGLTIMEEVIAVRSAA
jgi:hypothetical protein